MYVYLQMGVADGVDRELYVIAEHELKSGVHMVNEVLPYIFSLKLGVYVPVRLRLCVFWYVFVCVCRGACVCVCACVCECVCVCLIVYEVYVCIYLCIYVCLYLFIHSREVNEVCVYIYTYT